ncbi:MAG TPA: type II secretion system protein GspG, partial [Candidatus Sumerlaeota bacterium]|nr:type II secretion system protein GspG [Candidatus Sumerlaeota bacterium]
NFLEAQTRSKVSRAKADLRSISAGLEAYCVDNQRYPAARSFCEGGMNSARDYHMCPMEITTPVAYLSTRPPDVFNRKTWYKYVSPGFGFANGSPTFLAIWVPRTFPNDSGNFMDDVPHIDLASSPVKWALWSVGPSGDVGFWNAGMEHHPVPRRTWYDPTNGTISPGIIARLNTGHEAP